MDYRTEVINSVDELNEAKKLRAKADEIERNVGGYLEDSLGKMADELENRNTSVSKLSVRDKEVIDYVDSGRYSQTLELLPNKEKEDHQKRIDADYEKAKRKVSTEESNLVGYLTVRDGNGITRIDVKTPVRDESKNEEGSPSEALYEHHINVGGFNGEEIQDGFVVFYSEVERENVKNEAGNLSKRLSNDLPPILERSGVKYSVVEFLDDISVDIVEQVGETYSSAQALSYWKSNLEERNETFPRTIKSRLGKILDKGEFKIEKVDGVWKIEKKSFEEFVSRTKFKQIQGRYELVGLEDRLPSIPKKKTSSRKVYGEAENSEITVREAAEILGVGQSKINMLVREGELEKPKRNYVTLKSVKKVKRDYELSENEKRNILMRKKKGVDFTERGAAKVLGVSLHTVSRMIKGEHEFELKINQDGSVSKKSVMDVKKASRKIKYTRIVNGKIVKSVKLVKE
jgi:plasmid maintenance system antidote protein VapI